MPYSLQGRKVLVTASSRGLGALIAYKFAANGSHVAINYVSSADRANETAARIEKEFEVKTFLIQGDAGVQEDCVRIVKDTIAALGGLDILVSNAGWTKFTEFGDLYAMSDEDWDKCWAVNVKGHFHLFREAAPTLAANLDGGVFLVTSSVAGLVPSGSSLPYSLTKAAGIHLVKALATTQGPKIRVNAVLPGYLLTDWGQQFTETQIQAAKDRAVLKQETNLDDCANAYVAAAQNASMTGQCIQIDSGLFIR